MISVRCIVGLIWLMAAVMMAEPALAGVPILLTTQQPLAFAGNLTFVVEDVDVVADPSSGKVWMALYGDDGSKKQEMVLGKGEHFVYYGLTRIDITVVDIYAGEGTDLVSMYLNEGILVKNNANEGTPPAVPIPQVGNATGETAPVVPPAESAPQEPAADNATTDGTSGAGTEDVVPELQDLPEQPENLGETEPAAPEDQ
ncbi:MAG: hypothetical protein GKC10_05385 [Methanosarcinales archaeon]|nr:hypothetical protein [Methanosarcinales archaeon]